MRRCLSSRPNPAPKVAASSELALPNVDEPSAALRLAADLHLAVGDPGAMRAAMQACRVWLDCRGVLDLPPDCDMQSPDAIEALAGRITHCALCGRGACAELPDGLSRQRCAALAPHVHAAANAARKQLRASTFDQLPATWIVDRSSRVLDANAAAIALTTSALRFRCTQGHLVAATPAGPTVLERQMRRCDAELRVSWDDALGRSSLKLRSLPQGDCVSATVLPEPRSDAEVAELLSQRLELPRRQSELAARLLAGLSLVGAARAMGISRNTANEHLAALLRRAGVENRQGLLQRLHLALGR